MMHGTHNVKLKGTVLRRMTPWKYKYTDVSSLSLFRIATQRVFACYRRFSTAHRFNFQGSVKSKRMDILTAEGGNETLSRNVVDRHTAAA